MPLRFFVKIIQMSIILMYAVAGRVWLIPMKLEMSAFFLIHFSKVSTHKVERTSMTVRLTWTTMVTYWSVKVLIIWLRNISMQVGRVTCRFLCKK